MKVTRRGLFSVMTGGAATVFGVAAVKDNPDDGKLFVHIGDPEVSLNPISTQKYTNVKTGARLEINQFWDSSLEVKFSYSTEQAKVFVKEVAERFEADPTPTGNHMGVSFPPNIIEDLKKMV